MVAAGVIVMYDWVLTLGQEIELIWRQRWSLITVLYLAIRYVGIPYSVMSILINTPFVSVKSAGCINMFYALNGTNVIVTAMLGVIMIVRLYAMYQRSRMILVFLVVVFLAVNIACGVITIIGLMDTVGEEMILYGTYMCAYGPRTSSEEDIVPLLTSIIWVLNTVWEVPALCLAVWIAVKHFRDLRRLGQSTIEDCFRALIKSHVLYFASFAGVSCVQLAYVFPAFFHSQSTGSLTLSGACEVLLVVQMFVLGPHLILSVREFNAKLVTDSDEETTMASIVFQENVRVPTSSTV